MMTFYKSTQESLSAFLIDCCKAFFAFQSLAPLFYLCVQCACASLAGHHMLCQGILPSPPEVCSAGGRLGLYVLDLLKGKTIIEHFLTFRERRIFSNQFFYGAQVCLQSIIHRVDVNVRSKKRNVICVDICVYVIMTRYRA